MIMTAFPRLLVVTEFPPNAAGGGAAVVRQMLKPWPAEQLCWWSCLPERNELFGRKVAAHHVALVPRKLYPNRRWRAQRAWLLEKFWVPWATRHLRKTVDLLQPEVVWAIPHAQAVPPMARALPRAGIGLHVSIHDYMDDWAYGARFGPPRSRRIAALADQLYAAATTCDAISQPMLEDLRARTGRDGLITRAGLTPVTRIHAREDFYHGTKIRRPNPRRTAGQRMKVKRRRRDLVMEPHRFFSSSQASSGAASVERGVYSKPPRSSRQVKMRKNMR